jgi:citronellol/citronellal dehydrogenase
MGIYREGILSGKVAIITGGGTGIGKEISKQFGLLGAKIVIASRKREHIDPAIDEYRRMGIESIGQITDIRISEDVERLVDSTIERFGAIDILVNNAGGQFPSPAISFTPRGWDAVIKTNLTGTWYVTQQVAKKWMIPKGGGKIVNIVANMWRGFPGMAHTGAARAAVVNLTKSLAIEWAQYKIRINCVAPGIIKTEALERYARGISREVWRRVPLKRLGTPEEVANVVTFLASKAGDYITGETICVDGGAQLWGDLWPIPDQK